MKKKSLFVAFPLALSLLLSACGGSSSTSSQGSTSDKLSFTIFNSKSEIQTHLEEAAKAYGEENGVNIEVYYSNDTVAAHLSTKYASGDPYTLAMVDAKDVYSVGKQYGYDMAGQDWTKDTDYAITVDGKVLGFPVCIEARGLLYNAAKIREVTGIDFQPDNIKTTADFDAFCQKLVDAGLEKPTAILKPDWSLGAHYFHQIYEEREDVEGFMDALYAGEVSLQEDERFNSLMDTFDVLMKYNAFGNSPIAVEDDQVHQYLSEGMVAFQFGGCWEWNDIIDYDYTGEIGIMPVPQSTENEYSDSIVGGGSKYFYIDNSEHTSDAQREAASDFLNWLVYTEEGKILISETCGMVSGFSNNEVPCSNELGIYVKEFADAGKMIPNYDYSPDDHYTVVGAHMQEYLAGQADRARLASNVENYWANVTPVERDA